MEGSAKSSLTQLIKVSLIDSTLASLSAEYKTSDNKIREVNSALQKLDQELSQRERALNERIHRYQKDEKFLGEERAKLVERRKALATFSGQKVQQAASREIDATADKLNAQEEGLLSLLQEIESEKVALEQAKNEASERRESLKNTLADLAGNIEALNERKNRHESRRQDLASQVEKTVLATYQKVRDRYPHNAVVAITGSKTCAGCHMTLVAQTIVQVARHESLIKCPGCGRILALPEDIGENKEE